MKALIVGLGSVGTRHLNNLYRLGVTDLAAYRARNIPPPSKILIKNLNIFENYDNALRSKPDIVVIANPTSLHLPFAIKALKAGCHVYLEKPISHTMNGVYELLSIAQKKKLVIMIGCQLRFHPNLENIKEWLQKGVIGQIFFASVDVGEYLPSWHPWEDYRKGYAANANLGGGVILTLIHELDYLYWLLGPVKQVYAIGGHLTPLELDVEDVALISLLTKEDIPVNVCMDYWREPPIRKLHIVGEDGEIFWDYYKMEAFVRCKGAIVLQSKLKKGWERNELFIAIMKNFLDTIYGKTSVRIPLTEGIEVLKIALAAKASITQKEVICIK